MDISNDIVIEILSLLPVQSLLRFRSVCKSWRKIIDSSTFTYLHLQNHDEETLFLQFSKRQLYGWKSCQLSIDNGKSLKSFPAFQKFISDNFVGGKVTTSLFVAGPVNGLICVYNKTPYIDAQGSLIFRIAIYNPCLDKIKILPASPFCSSLECESSRTYHTREIGFGFDSVSKGYKVVQLMTVWMGVRPNSVEVYSRTTNSWRKLVTDIHELELYFTRDIQSSTHTKASVVYWSTNYPYYKMLSFKMQNEMFKTISLPVLERVRPSSNVFVKDDDSFVLFVYSSDDFCTLEVWELERLQKNWTHVRDVNIEPFTREGIRPWAIALLKRDVVVLMEYDDDRRDLIFYDYSAQKVTKCFEAPWGDIQILDYKCSLISP